jgi:hypothetical protein
VESHRGLVSLTPRPYLESSATSFIRAVTAQVMTKGSRSESPSQLLRKAWPDDRDAETIIKAASSPASLGVSSWAGILSMQRPVDFIGMLAPSSCGLALLKKCLMFDWPTGVNSLLIPAIDVSPARTPWQSEGSPISNVMFTTSVSAPMTPAKIASITVLSREILEYSLPSAELMVRTALGESLGLAIDTALLGSTAATSTTPAGIFNGVAPLTASTNTIPSEACVTDIAAVVSAVNAISGNHPVTLIASFKQAASLKARINIGAFDVLSCSTLPANTIAAVASNGLASIADAVPEFTVANEMSIHMDTSPSPVGSASPSKSMFQTDVIAIKIKQKLTWVLRHPAAVAWIQGCQW